jgi:hypothetical protein
MCKNEKIWYLKKWIVKLSKPQNLSDFIILFSLKYKIRYIEFKIFNLVEYNIIYIYDFKKMKLLIAIFI